MKLKFFLLIPIILLVTGCWDYSELNNMAVVTGISIDKEKDSYLVSILIANSKKAESTSSEGEAQTIVYSGKGKTLSEAMKQIDLLSPKRLYLGHLSVVVIDENIAKDGLKDILDFLLREPESIKRFYTILAKESKAIDALKVLSPLESFPSQSLYQNIKISSEAQAISLAVPYSSFIENMIKKGKNPVLPSLKIIGDIDKGSNSNSLTNSVQDAKSKIDTIGLFRKDKLIGYASEDSSRGISILLNAVTRTILAIDCNDGKAVANINRLSTKEKYKNNQIFIEIKGTAYLKEDNCNISLKNKKNIKKLENEFENRIKYITNNSINESKKYKTDIFGYGNLIYKSNPKYFKKIEKKWDTDFYPNLKTNINVKIKLTSKGSIEKSIKETIYE